MTDARNVVGLIAIAAMVVVTVFAVVFMDEPQPGSLMSSDLHLNGNRVYYDCTGKMELVVMDTEQCIRTFSPQTEQVMQKLFYECDQVARESLCRRMTELESYAPGSTRRDTAR